MNPTRRLDREWQRRRRGVAGAPPARDQPRTLRARRTTTRKNQRGVTSTPIIPLSLHEQAVALQFFLPRMNVLSMLNSLLKPAPRVDLSAYAARIRSGEALLVDVREPDEWQRGVSESAALLPLSDLRDRRELWRPFLAQAGPREILLYCASGMRSASAARLLQSEGVRAINAGGIGEFASAGWPIVPPQRSAG